MSEIFKAARDEVARYDREKADIKAQAESLGTVAAGAAGIVCMLRGFLV